MFLFSPLEQFQIIKLVEINVLGLMDISISNSSFYVLLILMWFKLIELYVTYTIIPTKWQSVIEHFVNEILKLSKDNLGNSFHLYFPLIFSLFLLILTLNLVGMIPYSLAVTSHIVVTFGVALSLFISITIIGFRNMVLIFLVCLCLKELLLVLGPLLVFIEILSYLARPISLGVRLAANMTAGHILLAIISGFIWSLAKSGLMGIIISVFPFVVLILIIMLELAVSFIQAYVFTLLVTIFLNDSIHLH
uniref:ATP synthase subunit a n=1 Tax=Sphaerothecum destruens TaxID=42893 RepID=A0A6H2U2A5_9EUKA|nr:ATP synthase F0 subunit 6 [Sphaerothecum destruens]QID02703.1 ATP synthase F0 subunit 6 [Sphaerothecum destruens]